MHVIWAFVAFVAVCAACAAVMGARFLAWPGVRVANVKRHANASSCAIMQVPGGDSVSMVLHNAMPDHSGVYNPSCAFVSSAQPDSARKELVTTARISTFTFCPGANILQHISRPFDFVGITMGGRAYQVLVPDAWATDDAAVAWRDSGGSGEWEIVAGTIAVSEKVMIMRQWAYEDPRVLELAPGVLGIVVSIQSPNKHYIRVALLVVVMPSCTASASPSPSAVAIESHEPSILTPQSLVLFPTRGQNTKNWMARVFDGRIYFVVNVHPQNVVSLALDDVLRARHIVVLEPRVDMTHGTSAGANDWRGNTVLVPLSSDLISIVHRKHYDMWHWGQWGIKAWGATFEHAFARFDATPPFAVRSVSRSFVIRPTLPEGARAQFVFCTGLAPIPDTLQFLVTFGVDDCYEASCVFEQSEIDALFSFSKTGDDAICVKDVLVSV